MGGIRKSVLTIAGFDPSGGAGVLADCKTFEQIKVNGFAVITANTIQDQDTFESVNWIDEELVLSQLRLVLKNQKIEVVKIGLIKNQSQLEAIIKLLIAYNPKIKIVWDPILSASAGFDFHQTLQMPLDHIFLLTPNRNEIKVFDDLEELKLKTNVFLKGGHAEDEKGVDYLYTKKLRFKFKPKRLDGTEKHGSGCVLSSAIVANLAKGYPLKSACLRAKDYVTKFLVSNKSKLGYHKT